MYYILEAMLLVVNSKRRKAAYNRFFVQALKLNFRIFYSSLTRIKNAPLFSLEGYFVLIKTNSKNINSSSFFSKILKKGQASVPVVITIF